MGKIEHQRKEKNSRLPPKKSQHIEVVLSTYLWSSVFMPNSKINRLLRNKNKRAVLLIEVGVKRGYELKKEKTWATIEILLL